VRATPGTIEPEGNGVAVTTLAITTPDWCRNGLLEAKEPVPVARDAERPV
jgi:hypothetical protein